MAFFTLSTLQHDTSDVAASVVQIYAAMMYPFHMDPTASVLVVVVACSSNVDAVVSASSCCKEGNTDPFTAATHAAAFTASSCVTCSATTAVALNGRLYSKTLADTLASAPVAFLTALEVWAHNISPLFLLLFCSQVYSIKSRGISLTNSPNENQRQYLQFRLLSLYRRYILHVL